MAELYFVVYATKSEIFYFGPKNNHNYVFQNVTQKKPYFFCVTFIMEENVRSKKKMTNVIIVQYKKFKTSQ